MNVAGASVVVLGLAALLCGCQIQHTTVLEQASSASLAANGMVVAPPPPRRTTVIPSPCQSPPGTGPYEHLSKPMQAASVPMPPRALAEHVRGCAGIRFRIGPDGVPQDITVVADYPAGYGFGEAASDAVSRTRWAPKDDMAWRYLVVNMRPTGS